MRNAQTPLASKTPDCLLCSRPTRLLYPSNVSPGARIQSGEVACTSPYLCLHDDIYYCQSCGLARSHPSVGSVELEDLYREVEDPEYLVSEDERRGSFRQALEVVEEYHPPGRLLEVGSAVGLFLDEGRKKGWQVEGIEPSSWASEHARRRNLEVYTGTLDSYNVRGEPFDAVVLWDVLEHLVDPVAALRRAGELLKPGGILAFATVNMGGLGARLSRGRWPWFMRMHLHYFTRRSLTDLVTREGFEVVRLFTQPKVLKLGYVLGRVRGIFGPLVAPVLGLAELFRLANRPIKVNLGDILFMVARK